MYAYCMTLEFALLLASTITKPAPLNLKPPAEHHFYDRTAEVELGAALALDAYDNVHTCKALSEKTRPIIATVTAIDGIPTHEVIYGPGTIPAFHEAYLPASTCGQVTALLTAELAGQELVAYALHRSGHHKLEKLVRFFTIEGNTQGIIYSQIHKH
jgi:hypothetical protein